MSEPRRPSLFDLPLDPREDPHEDPAEASPDPTGDAPRPEERQGPRHGTREQPRERAAEAPLPLFPTEDVEEPSPQASDPPRTAREPAPPAEEADRDKTPRTPQTPAEPRPDPVPAPLGARWRAGGLDLLLHTALALVLAFGSWLLGAPLEGIEILGLAVFVAVFSFLYTVIPLAFWGRTPGMKRAGLVAAGGDREAGALTFGQTALRWLGGLLTLSLLGLPSLLALIGDRSLTDRLSGSRTWRLPRSGDR